MYVTRGDSKTYRVRVKNYEISEGDFLELTVRNIPSSPEKLIYKKVESHEGDSFYINFKPQDTSDLSFGDYVYDVQLTLKGNVYTVIKPSVFTVGTEVSYD